MIWYVALNRQTLEKAATSSGEIEIRWNPMELIRNSLKINLRSVNKLKPWKISTRNLTFRVIPKRFPSKNAAHSFTETSKGWNLTLVIAKTVISKGSTPTGSTPTGAPDYLLNSTQTKCRFVSQSAGIQVLLRGENTSCLQPKSTLSCPSKLASRGDSARMHVGE